jgi:hypothetical protein
MRVWSYLCASFRRMRKSQIYINLHLKQRLFFGTDLIIMVSLATDLALNKLP